MTIQKYGNRLSPEKVLLHVSLQIGKTTGSPFLISVINFSLIYKSALQQTLLNAHPDSSNWLHSVGLVSSRTAMATASRSGYEGTLQLFQQEPLRNAVAAEFLWRTLTATPTCSNHSGTLPVFIVVLHFTRPT